MYFRIALLLCCSLQAVAQEGAWSKLAEDFTLGPVPVEVDLRTMLSRHLVVKSCQALDETATRRRQALEAGDFAPWKAALQEALLAGLGPMPFGDAGSPLNIRPVSRHEGAGYRVENVLFESLPGWDVNASVYLPLESAYPPPWPAVVVPVGHSCKVRSSYQYPAQIFARMGYVAVTFDPPGMAGEKQAGNDHFRDGVRCYLTGQSSNRYFVIDAIRCIDYLSTRPDVSLKKGVAMTGVSGGGTTSLSAAVLDPRITVVGPSCCAVPNALHPILDQYAPCAETLPFNRFHEYDDIDLILAAAPSAVLLMAGAGDEVFTEAMSQRMAQELESNFKLAGYADHFSFFMDEGGHAYSPAMARSFVAWMDRWLAKIPARDIPLFDEEALELLEAKVLACRPRQEGNIYSLNKAEAERLASQRKPVDITKAVRTLVGPDFGHAAPPLCGESSLVWHHRIQELALRPEAGIALPATYLYPSKEDWRGAAVLFFDDRGRWTGLNKQGRPAKLSGFLDKETNGPAILSVDLRGWGDSSPAALRYDLAGWGERDRWLSYVAAATGDSVMGMRIRDGLHALQWLAARPEIDPAKIVVGGYGAGGVVALHVAALSKEVAGIFTLESLASYELLATSKNYSWPMQTFLPKVLQYYDLPELITLIGTPVRIIKPLDASHDPLGENKVQTIYGEAMQEEGIQVDREGGFEKLSAFVREQLK